VKAVNCPQCLGEMAWSKEFLQWGCLCGFVIQVDPLLTCEECSSELWWNEQASQWQCGDCCAVVIDPLAEDRCTDRGPSLMRNVVRV
jgi:predicted RNA-binding Zn-ribbon protein involved in translation (DUF1610 family)